MIEYITKDKTIVITSIEATIKEIRKEINRIGKVKSLFIL